MWRSDGLHRNRHGSVVKEPIAGLPSVKTCMACHSQIATDRPLIRRLAALEQQGVDLAWQRVGYTPYAHLRFNHAPHARGSRLRHLSRQRCRQATAERIST
jgi:hypothetical protein